MDHHDSYVYLPSLLEEELVQIPDVLSVFSPKIMTYANKINIH